MCAPRDQGEEQSNDEDGEEYGGPDRHVKRLEQPVEVLGIDTAFQEYASTVFPIGSCEVHHFSPGFSNRDCSYGKVHLL